MKYEKQEDFHAAVWEKLDLIRTYHAQEDTEKQYHMHVPTYLNPNNYAHFKRAYQQAVDLEIGVFVFEGHSILTKYARWVVEAMDERIATHNK